MVQVAGSSKPKGKGKGKAPEIVFDEKARAEYLTGFRKRKQERKEAGREYAAKKAKEELLANRREMRKARREQAAENVRNERRAFGLEAEGESDLENNLDESDDNDDDDEDTAAAQQEEYDDDEHHTQVVVESFDPEQEAYAQATAAVASSSKQRDNLNGQGEETDHPHQEKDVTQKRLIVSGLTGSFTQIELTRRFSTFGEVVALDGFGKQDAVGQLRPYIYVTLRAPATQIKRCMNLLSGSMWKGAKLRIGEAKPDYHERWQNEVDKRKREEEEAQLNPKRTRLRPGTGVEAKYMDVVTESEVEAGLAWGWKRTPAGHLVRPLRMRPDHPLPRPKPLTGSSGSAKADGDAEGSKQRRARVNPRPPTKAHRITIDPTRYGAVHLSGPILESLAAETRGGSPLDLSSLGSGEWQCEEIMDEEHGDELSSHAHSAGEQTNHRLVRWQYVGKDGSVLHEEFTKLPIRVVPPTRLVGDEFDDAPKGMVEDLDFDRYSQAASDDLFSGFPTSSNPTASSSALPDAPTKQKQTWINMDNDNAAIHGDVEEDIDDLFSNFKPRASQAGAGETADLFSDLPSRPAAIVRPKPAAAQPARSLPELESEPTKSKTKKQSSRASLGTFIPGLDPDQEDPANFSDGYDEGPSSGSRPLPLSAADAAAERSKTLALLGEMFGSVADEDNGSNASSAQKQGSPPDVVVDTDSEEEDSSSSESSSEEESEPESGSSTMQDTPMDVVADEHVKANAQSADGSSGSSDDSDSSASDSSEEESGDEAGDDCNGAEEVEDATMVTEDGNADDAKELERPRNTSVAEPVKSTVIEQVPEAVAQPDPAPTTAKSRRAALLLGGTSTTSTSYQPIARFDPGLDTSYDSHSRPGDQNESDSAALDVDASKTSTSLSLPGEQTKAQPTATATATKTSVSMSTLKDMFKPSEVSTGGFSFSLGLGGGDGANQKDEDGAGEGSRQKASGFSLIDSLGLELDSESEPEEDPTGGSIFAPHSHPLNGDGSHYIRAQTQNNDRNHDVAQETRVSSNRPFFLTSTANLNLKDLIPNPDSRRVADFFTPQTPEQRLETWQRNKSTLTPLLKKRYREAVKARKRGRVFVAPKKQPVGSTSTGTSTSTMPMPTSTAPIWPSRSSR
ncbi:hypothetical protein BCV70DRAFT_115457 [Testicularia cyperi]|uniref:RRM domain-containing protein n=1 Tax=Testicularia cyperi TaxID=1882483 RepID=A0A317XMH3_9BASI|nr:hypothetical protein BCV70DRAFT_115457 [Testicularia cyperi]